MPKVFVLPVSLKVMVKAPLFQRRVFFDLAARPSLADLPWPGDNPMEQIRRPPFAAWQFFLNSQTVRSGAQA